MKRNLLFVVAIFLATALSAQLYVGARLGYGFGAQKYVAGTKVTNNSTENIWASIGQGLPIGLKAGYFFNDNLGVEFGVNYWMSTEVTVSDISKTGYTEKITAKSSQIRIMPQLVYKTDMGVYGRFGIVIPLTGKTIVNNTTEFMVGTSNQKVKAELEYRGELAVGFAGAMGYSYEIADNINLFGELEYVSLTIRSKTAEMTAYELNGVDKLSVLPTIKKETEFVDELTASSNNVTYNNTPDASKPLEDLRTSTVYSSMRINIGITMSF